MAFKSLTSATKFGSATKVNLATYKTPVRSNETPALMPLTDTLTQDEWETAVDYAATFPAPYNRLVDIHSYCRPHNSKTVDDFVEKFLMFYPSATIITSKSGEKMAVSIVTDAESKTLFSAHVDTVHSYSGRQLLTFDQDMGMLLKPTKARTYGDCLGADDGAGIWLLLEMIDAGVPGTYLFHYGEERGGVGSSLMAKEKPEFLRWFNRAVAFDRKGTTDVITYQGGSRCCSNKFAKSLSDALNATDQGLVMAPDDGGIFTDTANYTNLIPECTNIACGYESAHTSEEYLDTDYLTRLRNALLVIDWEALPTERDPTVIDNDWGSAWDTPWSGFGHQSQVKSADPIAELTDCVMQMRFSELLKFVKDTKGEDIAEVIYELTDRVYSMQERIYDLENERQSVDFAPYNDVDDVDFDPLRDAGIR